MKKVYRKGKVERTGSTSLKTGEAAHEKANYRTGPATLSSGGPTGTAAEGAININTSNGTVNYFYGGAWH